MSLTTLATELNKSAQKYRKNLLMLPSIGLSELIPHMTGRPGVTYKETVGEIFATSELRPYDGNDNEGDTTALKERTLETFLGSCVELFDPNALSSTVWAQLATHGNSVSDAEFSKAQLMAIMNSVMAKLGPAAWGAARNDAGTTTLELFNGFDTITATEITATNIAAAKGNFLQLGAAIDNTNAYDTFRSIYKAASPELRMKRAKVFADPDAIIAYEEDYMNTVGAAPYNNSFNQRILQGTGGLWELVPMVGKSGSDFIHVSTKQNMLYGYGNGVEKEQIEVRRATAFKLQFILAMFFGVEFATIDKRELMVAKTFAG